MSAFKTMGEKMFNGAATASTAASSDTPAFTTVSITRRFPSGALTTTTGASHRSSFAFHPGIIPALYQLTETLCTKDEKVLVNIPAYGYFSHAAEYAGVGILTSPMLKKAAGIIQKYNLWVVSDEIHCDLIRCGHRHIPMAKVMTDAIEKHNLK